MKIYGLTGWRLPIHPQPLADELFTHWLLRLAGANGLKVQTLADIALSRTSSFWARDPDRNPTDSAIQQFSKLSGKDENEILSLTLKTYDDLHALGRTSTGLASWILPLGIYHRTRRRYGMQFCPICLATDPIPYFRRKWRLAFYTFCDRHGTMLHDRCPQCSAPIAWIRNDIGRGRSDMCSQSTLCWQCAFDLRRSAAVSPAAIDGQSIIALRSLLSFHDLGWWFIENETLAYSHLYFSVLRRLAGWLPSRHGRALLEKISPSSWSTEYGSSNGFESRSLDERHRLLVTSHWLLQEWPERFLNAARSVGITQAYIFGGLPLPFWFEGEVKSSLRGNSYQPNLEEVENVVRYLQRRGEKVTAAAIGRIVGNTGSPVVLEFAQRRPPMLTEDEFWQGILHLISSMRKCRMGTHSRYVLWRDIALFGLAWYRAKSLAAIQAMSISEASEMTTVGVAGEKREQQVIAHLRTYLRYARPTLMQGHLDGALFPSGPNGKPLSDEGWRIRWRRIFGGRELPVSIARSV